MCERKVFILPDILPTIESQRHLFPETVVQYKKQTYQLTPLQAHILSPSFSPSTINYTSSTTIHHIIYSTSSDQRKRPPTKQSMLLNLLIDAIRRNKTIDLFYFGRQTAVMLLKKLDSPLSGSESDFRIQFNFPPPLKQLVLFYSSNGQNKQFSLNHEVAHASFNKMISGRIMKSGDLINICSILPGITKDNIQFIFFFLGMLSSGVSSVLNPGFMDVVRAYGSMDVIRSVEKEIMRMDSLTPSSPSGRIAAASVMEISLLLSGCSPVIGLSILRSWCASNLTDESTIIDLSSKINLASIDLFMWEDILEKVDPLHIPPSFFSFLKTTFYHFYLLTDPFVSFHDTCCFRENISILDDITMLDNIIYSSPVETTDFMIDKEDDRLACYIFIRSGNIPEEVIRCLWEHYENDTCSSSLVFLCLMSLSEGNKREEVRRRGFEMGSPVIWIISLNDGHPVDIPSFTRLPALGEYQSRLMLEMMHFIQEWPEEMVPLLRIHRKTPDDIFLMENHVTLPFILNLLIYLCVMICSRQKTTV
jgi:hypothetical protein